MLDHHDLQRVRSAIRDLMDAITKRRDVTDAELNSFVADTAGAEALLHPDEVALINNFRERAAELRRAVRFINETGSPAERTRLTLWFVAQKFALEDRQFQLKIHPDLIAGSR